MKWLALLIPALITPTGCTQGSPRGTVHFSNIQGSLPAGCAVDYQPFADNGMVYVTGTQGGNVLNFVLGDTSVSDNNPGKYSLAWSLVGAAAPTAGSTYPMVFKAGQGILEYNCYLTQPLSDWVVKDGQLKIHWVSGNSVSFSFTATMVAGAVNKTNTATLTIEFDGTTPYASGPAASAKP